MKILKIIEELSSLERRKNCEIRTSLWVDYHQVRRKSTEKEAEQFDERNLL